MSADDIGPERRSTRGRPAAGLRSARVFARAVMLGMAATALGCSVGDEAGSTAKPLRGEGPEAASAGPRLLVVGWDGATYRMIDPLLAAGRLPNLNGLVSRGVSFRLESTTIPVSSAAWLGAVTGKTPGQTGVFSFFEGVPGSYDVKLIDARSNRSTPIWRILGRRGLRSIVFGVPVTYPPEPIRGAMVSGMLTPARGVWAHPPELDTRLKESGFLPDMGMWRRQRAVRGVGPLERQLMIKQQQVQSLLRDGEGGAEGRKAERTDPWRLALVVFKSLDVLSHAEYDGSLGGRVARHYEMLDGVLGALLAQVGPETTVLVMSDHGFNAYYFEFNPRAWLLEQQLAVERPGGIERKRLGKGLAQQRVHEQRARRGSLEMAQTRVLATAAEGNFGTLRLNVRGREPEGSVAPEDVGGLLAEVERKLRQLRLPEGGPLVSNIFRGAEHYPGARSDRLPDLIFEVSPAVAVRVSLDAPVLWQHDRALSDHDREGIFVGAGPRIAHRSARGDLSIFDVAPTALQLLGLPAYEEMVGRVVPLAAGAVLDRVREADDEPDTVAVKRFLEQAGTGPDEGVRHRLEALGYVE